MNRRSFLKATVSAGTLAAAPAVSKQADVQIGVCAGTEDLAKAERWGFDYLEPAAAAIAALSAAEFERVRQQVLASRIRCRSFNSLIRTMYVVGSEANLDAVFTYLDSVRDRCRRLGARVVVWGSSSSRNIPTGYSREQTWQEIKRFLQRAGDIAAGADNSPQRFLEGRLHQRGDRLVVLDNQHAAAGQRRLGHQCVSKA